MSFQAGLIYFDGVPISEPDSSTVSRWVRTVNSARTASQRRQNVVLAHSAVVYGAGLDCAITFDGRIDNRADLLVTLRHALRDTSDRALALAAYKESGVDGFAQIVGDWSLAIWDPRRRAIVLASDFAGVRPLYYAVLPNAACWSTRLAPLAEWLGIDELDDIYVAGLLGAAGRPNRTPYRGIYSVPPGHAIEITETGVKKHEFWRLPVDDRIEYSRDQEYEEHLRSLFRDAVHCRMAPGGASICELSGGFDSSSVAAMAMELIRSGEVDVPNPVAVSFEHQGSRDKPFYTAVARTYGLESFLVSTAQYAFLASNETGDALPAFWTSLDKHTAAIAKELGATTYLTGQLGDAVMGNWDDDSDQVAGLLRDGRLRTALKEALAWSLVLRIPIAWIVGRALQLWLAGGADCKCELNPYGSPQETEDSLTWAFRTRMESAAPDSALSQDWKQARPGRRRHFRTVMHMLQMRRLQPPEALTHLNYTHPFTHRPLVTFMLSIPAIVACRPGEPRRLMRRAFQALWPAELVGRRSKDTFGGVFLESLRPLARTLLNENPQLEVVERGYVDPQSLRSRLERLSASLSCNEPQLRRVILLEFWLRQRKRATLKQTRDSPCL